MAQRNTYREDEELEEQINFRDILRVGKYLKPYMAQVARILVVVISMSCIVVAVPYLTKIMIDEAIPNKDLGKLGILAVILAARNLWHPVDQPAPALADITLWGLFTGAGFILAAPLVPGLVRALGLGRTALALLIGCAAVSLTTAFVSAKLGVFVLSFLIGLGVQSFKICVDTIVQAHVDEGFKGRVFSVKR